MKNPKELQYKKFVLIRRSFEALKFSKGSKERNKLNENSDTSEYYPSKKYSVVSIHHEYPQRDFITKAEAIAYIEAIEKL